MSMNQTTQDTEIPLKFCNFNLLTFFSTNPSDVFEVSYVFHHNDVGRLQTVTVDIKRIHSVDIISIGIEI